MYRCTKSFATEDFNVEVDSEWTKVKNKNCKETIILKDKNKNHIHISNSILADYFELEKKEKLSYKDKNLKCLSCCSNNLAHY